MTEDYAVAAFYRFTRLDAPAAMRAQLAGLLGEISARGTVLLAGEGLNGTLCVPTRRYTALVDILRAVPGCEDLAPRRSSSLGPAFRRLKVRVKPEIVTMGVAAADPAATVGTYVDPEDWNAFIRDPGTLVVDTRNAYEVSLGTFQGAEDPGTDTFRDFPAWLSNRVAEAKPDKIAMFCTGGIRCEKATSFARRAGLGDVYHLRGGILAYLQATPPAGSLWQGECFVFDERVSLVHGLRRGAAKVCHACKYPVAGEDQSDPHYEEGVSCPKCYHVTTPAQKARFAERQRQVRLAMAAGRAHLAGT
ncbi:MAG: rhodanese-related sulfurtransferase [Pseudomonadota bacterium]